MKVKFPNRVLLSVPGAKTHRDRGNKEVSVTWRFRAGVQEVPDELRPYLPADAEILSDNYVPEVKEPEGIARLSEFDQAKAEMDQVAEAHEQANEVLAKRKGKKNATGQDKGRVEGKA